MGVFGFGRRIRRTRNGDFQVRLTGAERDLLRPLPDQLRELLGTDDDSLRRLFPPAYKDEPEFDAEYQRLMRDDLVERRLQALDVLTRTIDAQRLDEEELLSWLGALNDIRLVLGTRLDVTEETSLTRIDPRDPDAPMLALYGYLGWLEEQVVDALSAG